MKKAKALVLLSGGLDSMLAAKILMESGVEVTGITFVSNFFGSAKAKKAADQLGIKLVEVDFKDEHLAMVKEPKYGYGKNLNPCIDCHALMIRRSKEIMEENKYDFIATGEVLGQRPMSQNKNSLVLVAKYSGAGDRLVRPLSARLLDETMPEKIGLLSRSKLLDLSGRSRKRQVELAEKFGLKEYPSPAGGCLLTDPGYSQHLKKLLDSWPECTGDDTELIKHGRIFWLIAEINGVEEKVLLIIGRNREDNEVLQKSAKSGDIMVELVGEIGPTALIRFNKPNPLAVDREFEIFAPEALNQDRLKFSEAKNREEIISLVATLVGHYAVKSRGKKIRIRIINL